MLKKNPTPIAQHDLLRSRLDSIIDPSHQLVKLAKLINWDALERDLRPNYCQNNGRPGEPIRLMAGLLFLKEIKGISDEQTCATWRENPYFQYFCGEDFFQHDFPVQQPSIGNFRRRIGKKGMERLLQETIRTGLKSGTIREADLQEITMDTTVQEKAVKYPTDVDLCHKARQELVDQAKKHGISLRQNYRFKGKQAHLNAKRRRKKQDRETEIRRCRNYLGRVARDIERAAHRGANLSPAFDGSLTKARIIYNQTLHPKAKEKIYSWHAPEVECIAKGKAHKRYEFGCKASYAVTNASNFIVGALALHGKPYDGHTLKPGLAQVKRLIGLLPREVHVDRGYKGHRLEHSGVEVIMAGHRRGLSKAQLRRQKRRNAIEPIIGHCKHDRKVGPRNWLKGRLGDHHNVLSVAIGFNLRKILRKIFLRLFWGWLKACFSGVKLCFSVIKLYFTSLNYYPCKRITS